MDGPTDGPTDERTDRPSYRDAWTYGMIPVEKSLCRSAFSNMWLRASLVDRKFRTTTKPATPCQKG